MNPNSVQTVTAHWVSQNGTSGLENDTCPLEGMSCSTTRLILINQTNGDFPKPNRNHTTGHQRTRLNAAYLNRWNPRPTTGHESPPPVPDPMIGRQGPFAAALSGVAPFCVAGFGLVWFALVSSFSVQSVIILLGNCMLFTAAIALLAVFTYLVTKQSRKFCSEAITFIHNLLMAAMYKKPGRIQDSQTNLSRAEINYDPDRERAEMKKLKKRVRWEAQGAARELRKDNHFLSGRKEKDKAQLDEERAEKGFILKEWEYNLTTKDGKTDKVVVGGDSGGCGGGQNISERMRSLNVVGEELLVDG
ncbi:hypothetical protein RHGRI_016968 [Rhododendron griersonianum]|uniref:Uncharacterized protein n=1 Tax=Rhododendron griersonianum TaxID=479676 RepID=A0AAV6JW47_9ERIC|nr:hypothetical protein RHGRI_016968 [Rhododendron griersonianum]